jgi:hypothetical protein
MKEGKIDYLAGNWREFSRSFLAPMSFLVTSRAISMVSVAVRPCAILNDFGGFSSEPAGERISNLKEDGIRRQKGAGFKLNRKRRCLLMKVRGVMAGHEFEQILSVLIEDVEEGATALCRRRSIPENARNHSRAELGVSSL